ncbi:MAG: hypothetical protein ACI9CU_002255, partial [Polaribacter sp.]
MFRGAKVRDLAVYVTFGRSPTGQAVRFIFFHQTWGGLENVDEGKR